MSNKSIHYSIEAVQLVAPAAKTSTVTSTAFDRELGVSGDKGAPYEALEVLVEFGAWTDGSWTPKLQESTDNNSDYTDVAAANQLGTFTAVTSTAGQNKIQRVAYVGSQRYVQVVVPLRCHDRRHSRRDGATCLPAQPAHGGIWQLADA